MYRAALPIAKALHAQKPFDLLHAHMLPREGHAGRLLGRALGLPVALTVHGTDVFHYFIPGQTPWKRNVETARRVDALMAVSSLLLSRVAPYRGEGRISRVVQNGVDLSLVPENEAPRPRAVISVGTLKARKCMDKTLEAFARLADEYGDATLTIVGIGEMEQALRARIAELHLEGRVTLTGGLPHEEVLRRMAQSDLFVLPSWGEGYGIVYIEAMAAGCIAVGAENEGIADTITDGRKRLSRARRGHGRGGARHARRVRPSRGIRGAARAGHARRARADMGAQRRNHRGGLPRGHGALEERTCASRALTERGCSTCTTG